MLLTTSDPQTLKLSNRFCGYSLRSASLSCLVRESCLPGEAAAGWWPCAEDLAEEDDAAEVVGIVGGEADELLFDGHGAGGFAGAAGTLDSMLKVGGDLGEAGGVGDEDLESVAERGPGFGLGLLGSREAFAGGGGVGRGLAVAPVEGEAEPEGDVPELGVDGMGCAGDEAGASLEGRPSRMCEGGV